MISFIEGFLLGMGAAMPLGPINLLIMNRALREYKSAVSIGAGALSADMVYLILILLGVATFFSQPIVVNILGVLGSTFLLYMSYQIFKSRNHTLTMTEQPIDPKSFISYYIQGFTLTFINPYTIAFWLSIAGYTTFKNSDALSTIAGMLCAIFLWITLMPYIVHRSKHRISQKTSYYLSLISGLILLGFALSLLMNMFIL